MANIISFNSLNFLHFLFPTRWNTSNFIIWNEITKHHNIAVSAKCLENNSQINKFFVKVFHTLKKFLFSSKYLLIFRMRMCNRRRKLSTLGELRACVWMKRTKMKASIRNGEWDHYFYSPFLINAITWDESKLKRKFSVVVFTLFYCRCQFEELLDAFVHNFNKRSSFFIFSHHFSLCLFHISMCTKV